MKVENLPDKADRISEAQRQVNQYQREQQDKNLTGHEETQRDLQDKNHSVTEVVKKELEAQTN